METLTSEVKVAIKWFDTNRMEANPSKFQAITLNAAEDPRAHINLGDKVIIAESTVKLLGVHLDDNLNFNQQTKELCRKAASQLNVLRRLARHLDQGCRMSIFRAFILTHFNYCALVWHFCGATNTKKLERIQCRALRFVAYSSTLTATIRRFSTEPVYRHWSSHGNEKSSSRSTRLPCTCHHVGRIYT